MAGGRQEKIVRAAKIGLLPKEIRLLCGVKMTKREAIMHSSLFNTESLKRRAKRIIPQVGKYPRSRIKSAYFSNLRHHIKQSGLDIKVSQRDFRDIFEYELNDLIAHIEGFGFDIRKFGEWEIDHIIPKSKLRFKAIGDYNFVKCWSLANIQPLDKYENRSKRDK